MPPLSFTQNNSPTRKNKHIMLNPTVTSTGRSIRNILGKNFTRRAGIHNTKGKFYTNGPSEYNNSMANNNIYAIKYRRITNNWTPLTRNKRKLNEANSKILANVYSAAAPNYNYQTMVNSVWNRKNIDQKHKSLISDRLYALYGEEDEEEENARNWRPMPAKGTNGI